LLAESLREVGIVDAVVAEGLQDLGSPGITPIADDTQLPILERLPSHRLDRDPQHVGPVVGRYDYGYGGIRHSPRV
jgi:hypothetical protein